jgi:RNA-binding protein YhbY
MPDHDVLLAKVRKLLAKAEDPGVTEAEAELYNTKAAELIARYGIDRAMLAADDRAADELTSVKVRMHNPYSRDKAELMSTIARPLRCRAVFHQTGKSVAAVTVFGFRSDVDRSELLFTSLLLQAGTQLHRVRPDATWGRESVAAYRRTWLHGFTIAVYRRLVAAEERAAAEHAGMTTASGRSTELVLRDRKSVVDAAYAEEFAGLGTMPRRRLSGSGYFDGELAGRRANLGTTGLGGNRVRLPAN